MRLVALVIVAVAVVVEVALSRPEQGALTDTPASPSRESFLQYLTAALRGRPKEDAVQRLLGILEDGRLEHGPAGQSVQGRRGDREVRFVAGDVLEYAVAAPGAQDGRLATTEARRLAGAHAVETLAAVRHLATCGFQEVEVRGGYLLVRRPRTDFGLRRASVAQILDALVALAPLLERAPITIRVGAGEPPRVAVAWRMGDAILCPYCRDALAAETDDVDTCGVCRTAHHRDCLTEAGGCTVFGCAGRPPGERARS